VSEVTRRMVRRYRRHRQSPPTREQGPAAAKLGQVWKDGLRPQVRAFMHGPAAPLIRRVLKTILLEYYVVYGDESRLRLQPSTQVNNALFNTVSGNIDVGEHVFFGFNVCVLTGTHDYRRLDPSRMDAVLDPVNDISIGEGAWIATNATILGPCRIGEWSVVAAGSLVRSDVPPYAIAAGVPAKVVARLERGHESSAL
jgi:acetyltransferase-like isoleucine patch superfamily enzyme